VILGAFLAEAASAVDNKLTVSGGVLSRFAVEADRSAQFLLVVLTQAETDSPVRRIDVEIRPPTDEEPLFIEFELQKPPPPPRSGSRSSGSMSSCLSTAVG